MKEQLGDQTLIFNLLSETINLKDDKAPEFENIVKKVGIKTIDDFKVNNYFKASDDQDLSIKDFKLEKDDDGYFVSCVDKSDNKATSRIEVDINDVYEDIIVIDDSVFELNAYKLYTKKTITNILNHIHNEEIKDLNLDEYVERYSTEGQVNVTYKVGEEEKSIKLNIIVKEKIEEVEEETLNGWDAFWQKLGNWFRGVFTKFKFNCFITDEEWDLRFSD